MGKKKNKSLGIPPAPKKEDFVPYRIRLLSYPEGRKDYYVDEFDRFTWDPSLTSEAMSLEEATLQYRRKVKKWKNARSEETVLKPETEIVTPDEDPHLPMTAEEAEKLFLKLMDKAIPEMVMAMVRATDREKRRIL